MNPDLCSLASALVSAVLHSRGEEGSNSKEAVPVSPEGLDVERLATWIAEHHPARASIEEIEEGDRIYDWACAECVTGYRDVQPVPGFRCVPHQARAALVESGGTE